MIIKFNKPHITGNEEEYINDVIKSGSFAGNGHFSKKCADWLEQTTGCKKAILTPSGTAALEMMMLLADIGPGDEVIMPSFTFSSTANAVVLRGAVPVFIDIRPDTLNINEYLIEKAITTKTKAILPVHYAGVTCNMDSITKIAKEYGLLILEDAAQALLSYHNKEHLGTLGQMGALSFHETKNIHCGEGGALLINDPKFIENSEILMEKGTDRSKFFRGEVDKYTWIGVGSSYLINEITAAFLWAQLEQAKNITQRRMSLWNEYNERLSTLETRNHIRRPTIPKECTMHNAHIYYILLNSFELRNNLMMYLKALGVHSAFHYIPLDSSPSGIAHARSFPDHLDVTSRISQTLLRLPLFLGLETSYVCKHIYDFFN